MIEIVKFRTKVLTVLIAPLRGSSLYILTPKLGCAKMLANGNIMHDQPKTELRENKMPEE